MFVNSYGNHTLSIANHGHILIHCHHQLHHAAHTEWSGLINQDGHASQLCSSTCYIPVLAPASCASTDLGLHQRAECKGVWCDVALLHYFKPGLKSLIMMMSGWMMVNDGQISDGKIMVRLYEWLNK